MVKNEPLELSSSIFFLMRTVRSLWSAICKKRFRNPTYIDLTRVNRVNTNWGKSPALYNGVHVLVLFNHIYFQSRFQSSKSGLAHSRFVSEEGTTGNSTPNLTVFSGASLILDAFQRLWLTIQTSSNIKDNLLIVIVTNNAMERHCLI